MQSLGNYRLQSAKALLKDEILQKKAEDLMKKSYKLIETLRKEITGEETTFKIAFDVGGAVRGNVYELSLPLSEILDLTHLGFVSSSNATSAASTIKLRFQKYKAADKLALYNKYSAQLGTDTFKNISKEYQSFYRQTKKFGLTLSSGRQYEFFKKAQAKNIMHDESALIKLRESVSGDRLSFVKGVDFAYQDNSGYHFESLKSFIGGSPSLASFTTLLSTLQQTSQAINKLVYDDNQLTKFMNDQMQQHQPGIDKAVQETVKKAIPEKVIEPTLNQIFPQSEDIFNLFSI